MSEHKPLDNKQMIHIGCEVVALMGLAFYFSGKNKTLQTHIEELSQKIEEQDDKIQKLEEMVKNMNNNFSMAFNQLNNQVNNQLNNQVNQKVSKQPHVKIVKSSDSTRAFPPNHTVKQDISSFINSPEPVSDKPVSQSPVSQSPVSQSPLEPIREEEDNDADIEEELSELENTQNQV